MGSRSSRRIGSVGGRSSGVFHNYVGGDVKLRRNESTGVDVDVDGEVGKQVKIHKLKRMRQGVYYVDNQYVMRHHIATSL